MSLRDNLVDRSESSQHQAPCGRKKRLPRRGMSYIAHGPALTAERFASAQVIRDAHPAGQGTWWRRTDPRIRRFWRHCAEELRLAPRMNCLFEIVGKSKQRWLF